MLKTKNSIDFEIKGLTEAGTFEGWASVYGVVDSYGDMVMPGAFTKTMSDSGGEVVVLNQHNQRDPIGLGRLRDDAKGLWIEGALNLDLRAAQEAYSNVKKRILKGLSIGYETVDERLNAKRVRELTEVKLFEVSLVTFQACPGALVQSAKSRADINTIRDFEDFLRDAGFSRSEAKSIASSGWRQRDAEDTPAGSNVDTAQLAALLATRTQNLRRLTWN